jgi:hypothetical protein
MTSRSFTPSRNKPVNSQESVKANRYNVVMCAMVELGLKIMKYKNTLDAAHFLTVAGVPMRVISRVLLRPDLRRNLKRRNFA